MTTRIAAILALIAIVSVGRSSGQSMEVVKDDRWCRHSNEWDDDSYRLCEVREITLKADREVIRVDAEPNGGISIRGWDQNSILVRAKVSTSAKSPDAAANLAKEVTIETSGTIQADGPRTKRRQWFSVSYEIFAPHSSNIDLETKNGGVSITEIDGRVRFQTLNGGVDLTAVAGEVKGRTTNGGVNIELTGDRWEGRGLDVETVNGGVSIFVPEDYSAELETGTVNGHIEFDFPVLVEGKIKRRLNATLGDGGKIIRAITTNGGVVVTRG